MLFHAIGAMFSVNANKYQRQPNRYLFLVSLNRFHYSAAPFFSSLPICINMHVAYCLHTLSFNRARKRKRILVHNYFVVCFSIDGAVVAPRTKQLSLWYVVRCIFLFVASFLLIKLCITACSSNKCIAVHQLQTLHTVEWVKHIKCSIVFLSSCVNFVFVILFWIFYEFD